MESIKCLLLLAAVLALAAMNAAAMHNPNVHIDHLVTIALENIRRGPAHNPIPQINELAQIAMENTFNNVRMDDNYALAGLAAVVEAGASRSTRDPRDYVVQVGENAQACHDSHHMDFKHCLSCCTKKGSELGQFWVMQTEKFMEYHGLCVCRYVAAAPPPPGQFVREALRIMSGEVINPPREAVR
jgi:Tfp pilus assembly protein PilV